RRTFAMSTIRQFRPAHWRFTLVACAALAVPVSAPAQAEPASADEPQEHPRPKELVVSPRAEPVPALKYRLLPSTTELNPGDAAPIYLRIHGYEDRGFDEHWRQIGEKSARWMPMPIKELPAAEVRAFVNIWSGKLKQLEFGTRRKT